VNKLCLVREKGVKRIIREEKRYHEKRKQGNKSWYYKNQIKDPKEEESNK
jgi:hypothetical protein